MIKPPRMNNEIEIAIWREQISRLLNKLEVEVFPPATPPQSPPPITEDD